MKKVLTLFVVLFGFLCLASCNKCNKVNDKDKKESYTIIFDTDGGTAIDSITAQYESNIEMPIEPQKKGYSFDGWDKEIPTTMPAENLIIKAKWKVNEYTITFDTDGGTDIPSVTENYKSAILVPDDPIKTGYTFLGWDREIPTTMPAEDLIIKAKWKINKYTISFDTDGGSRVSSIIAQYGTEIIKPDEPTKKYHTFTGWDKEIPTTMPAEDLIIKANWQVNQYTITFDTDGGSEIEPMTVDYGTTIIPPDAPTKFGYVFVGWDDEIPTIMPGKNLTFKAIWTINEYSITYNLDGGKVEETLVDTYIEGIGLDSFPIPTKVGYFFKGWYTSNTYETAIINISSETSGDIELYAKWEKNPLANLNFGILGDSISTFYNPYSTVNSIFNGAGQYYYPKLDIKNVAQTWWYKTINALGTNLLVNNSYSGGTVTSNGISSGNDIDRIEKFFYNNTNPDVIIIYLGINDAGGNYTKEAFKKEYQGMIDKILKRFPKVQLFICTLPYSSRDGVDAPRIRYNEGIFEISETNNIPIIDFASAWTSKNYATYLSEGLHPNETGMTKLSELTIKKIKEFYKIN